MKKRFHDKKATLALFLALVIALMACVSTLVACTNQDVEESPTETDDPSTPETPTEPDETPTEDDLAQANEEKYLEAFDKLEQGDYEAAYALFVALGDYKDAAKEAAKFRYVFDGYTDTYGEPDDMETETVVVTYNEDNLPIKCEKSYLDGFVHTCTFEYDENGRFVRHSCDDEDEYYGTHEWTYDENGNVLTYVFHHNNGAVYSERRTYDENGNNLTIEADGRGDYYEEKYGAPYYAWYEIFYDENGYNTKYSAVDGLETLEGELWYSEDGVLARTLETVTRGEDVTLEEELYDEKGNLIRTTITKDGEVIQSSDSTYDENGNCLSEVYKQKEEDGEYVWTYNYTYDENGNCIKKFVEDNGYTSERNATFRLVYVPYEYSEQEWAMIFEALYYW